MARSWASTRMGCPCPKRRSSTFTSTPSTRSSTGRAASRPSRPAPPSSRCPPSRSPTTARSPAPIELYREAGKARGQAGSRLRGLRRRRPPRPDEGERPPHAPRRDNAGYPNLIKLSSARLPRGLLLQAARRLGAPRAPLRRADRALRLPLRARLQGARGGPARRRARPSSTGSSRSSARTTSTSRSRTRTSSVQQRINPLLAKLAEGTGLAARRDRRRPLPPPRGRARARGAALHPVRRLAQEPEPLEVRHRPLLLQVAGGDGARLPRLRARAPAHARGRRALQRRDRARRDPAAEVPDARRARQLRLPRRADASGPREALRQGHRPSSTTGSSSSSRRSARWASPTTS